VGTGPETSRGWERLRRRAAGCGRRTDELSLVVVGTGGRLGSRNESVSDMSGKSNCTGESLEQAEHDPARSEDVHGDERRLVSEKLDKAILDGGEELEVDLAIVTLSAVPSAGVRSP
jgi:hypothetical protein